MRHERFVCLQDCGVVAVDEDGLCRTCGSDTEVRIVDEPTADDLATIKEVRAMKEANRTTPPEPKATEPSDGELLATGRAIADELAGPLTRMHRTIPYGAARDAAGIAYCHAFRAGSASHRCCFDPPAGAPIDVVAPSDEELQSIEGATVGARHVSSTHIVFDHDPVAKRRALYNAGRASRAAEVAGLRARVLECETLDSHLVDVLAEVEALKAERDKLHAALAWFLSTVRAEDDKVRWLLRVPGRGSLIEEHDGTPAGRAAALVRLWERVTGGEHG